MNTIDKLDEKFGIELETMRILLISAGGYSQRMPNATVLGKIFMTLPIGSHLYQVSVSYKLIMLVGQIVNSN